MNQTPRIKAQIRETYSEIPAFTLLELLVVIGIIASLLVVALPAITSLSKSSGRKGAVSRLLGAIEQARSLALRDGQATYLVFPDKINTTDAATIERYSYRSFAIFEDDVSTPGTIKQITPWQTLATGICIRKNSLDYLANTLDIPFTPLGSTT
ncbi:MAG TPA: type II secretion system protein, partial [Chthoniobacterales bacterium]